MSTTQNTNNRGADSNFYVSEDIASIEPETCSGITLEGNTDGWYFYTGMVYLCIFK